MIPFCRKIQSHKKDALQCCSFDDLHVAASFDTIEAQNRKEKKMKIKRVICGEIVEIELTETELREAYEEQGGIYDREDIELRLPVSDISSVTERQVKAMTARYKDLLSQDWCYCADAAIDELTPNEHEEHFKSFLGMTDFELIVNEDGSYGLKDLQGAPLGDIEDCKFVSAEQVIERMDSYIQDALISDIGELMGEDCPTEWDNYADFCEECKEIIKNNPDKFKHPDLKFELNVLETICFHTDDVSLYNVWASYGKQIETR